MAIDHNDLMRMTHTCLVCGEPSLEIREYGHGGSGRRATFECKMCKSTGKLSNMQPWKGNEFPLDKLKALFVLAGIEIIGAPKELKNQYWGELPDGAYPWWFVKTKFGWIEIGWRKRVVDIDWSDTPLRIVVTDRNVTKDGHFVHAYSYEEVLEYLTTLAQHAAKHFKQET
jgi:hypothetical protein